MTKKYTIVLGDNTTISGDLKYLINFATRYTDNFSDKGLRELRALASCNNDLHGKQLIDCLIESRDELKKRQLNLGAVKLALLQKRDPAPLQFADGSEAIVWRENNEVYLAITGHNIHGTWHSVNSYSLQHFLDLPSGGLEAQISMTRDYNTVYEQIAV